MNVTRLKLLSMVVACLFLVLSLCQCDGKLIPGKGDAALDGAGDGESDRDGDSGSDAETAGDADTDVDPDGDGDGVADVDGDTDADSGTDAGTDIVPATYLSEDFESADWADNFRMWPDGNIFREGGVAARNGSFGIRMHVSPGEHWGGAIFFDHAGHGQGGNFLEIWSRYYIRFGPNWRRSDYRSGKAGYRARSDEVCRAPCLEMTDSHHFTEPETGLIYGVSYYHRNVSDQDLADGTFSHRGRDWTDGLREREQWYCVETHHVLNTPGQNDGVYQNWLDGELVSDLHGVRQRDSARFDIDNSVLITYIGGDWVADRHMNVYYDDWAVSDQRIGCD